MLSHFLLILFSYYIEFYEFEFFKRLEEEYDSLHASISCIHLYHHCKMVVKHYWDWLIEFYNHTINYKWKQKQKSSVNQTIYEGWLCSESHVLINTCQQIGDSRPTPLLKASHVLLEAILGSLRWFWILATVLRKMPSSLSGLQGNSGKDTFSHFC